MQNSSRENPGHDRVRVLAAISAAQRDPSEEVAVATGMIDLIETAVELAVRRALRPAALTAKIDPSDADAGIESGPAVPTLTRREAAKAPGKERGHGALGDDSALSVREAADLLGISRSLAYELVARGEIPSVRLGRRIVVSRRSLEGILNAPE